jgi:phage shock protein PspC (stress-responsive transcriptional regulator)
LFGGFADTYGLTQTLLVLACGFWAIGFLVTIAYYFIYPSEAERLRQQMGERRAIIVGEGS